MDSGERDKVRWQDMHFLKIAGGLAVCLMCTAKGGKFKLWRDVKHELGRKDCR